MKLRSNIGTLLSIPLIEEKYGRALAASLLLHAALFFLLYSAPISFPSQLRS